MNSPVLVVEHIVKEYGGNTILKGINFSLGKGMVYSLLGPNGAGKTTLLNIIAGVINPTSGRVLVKGFSPRSLEAKKILGYCPQEPALYDELTGYENILFYARLYGVAGDVAKRRIHELLESIGYNLDLEKRVGKYSGGMKKILSLAITLLHDPEILILDEPTAGMDPHVRRSVWDLLLKLRRNGETILLSTHYMDEADALSDKVAIINDGVIIAEGSPGELKEKYGPRSVISIEVYGGVRVGRVVDLLKSFTEVVYSSGNTVKIHVDDPDEILPKIISQLYMYGIRISSLRVLRPSLEDVFLKLTGRRLEE